MATNPKAVEAKNKGNAFFKDGRHAEAIKAYSEAIALEPNDHVGVSLLFILAQIAMLNLIF